MQIGSPGLSALLAIAAMGCSDYTRIRHPPAALLGDFESYASPAVVRAQLSPHLQVTVIEDSRLPPGDWRPPFDFLRLSVKGFQHLGHVGEVHTLFFNDRLMSTWFLPDAYEEYMATLSNSGLQPPWGRAARARINRFTEIWTFRNSKGRGWVVWQDSRLAKEESRWIVDHS